MKTINPGCTWCTSALNKTTLHGTIVYRLQSKSERINGQEKPSHPFAFEINSKIVETKGLINEYIKRTVNFGKPVTVEGIIASLTNKGENKSFLDFMQHYITRPPEKLEPNTIKKYATTLTHLKKFKRQIFFAEIDNTLLRDFNRFMQSELELGGAAFDLPMRTACINSIAVIKGTTLPPGESRPASSFNLSIISSWLFKTCFHSSSGMISTLITFSIILTIDELGYIEFIGSLYGGPGRDTETRPFL